MRGPPCHTHLIRNQTHRRGSATPLCTHALETRISGDCTRCPDLNFDASSRAAHRTAGPSKRSMPGATAQAPGRLRTQSNATPLANPGWLDAAAATTARTFPRHLSDNFAENFKGACMRSQTTLGLKFREKYAEVFELQHFRKGPSEPPWEGEFESMV